MGAFNSTAGFLGALPDDEWEGAGVRQVFDIDKIQSHEASSGTNMRSNNCAPGTRSVVLRAVWTTQKHRSTSNPSPTKNLWTRRAWDVATPSASSLTLNHVASGRSARWPNFSG